MTKLRLKELPKFKMTDELRRAATTYAIFSGIRRAHRELDPDWVQPKSETLDQAISTLAEETINRMRALCVHYGISLDANQSSNPMRDLALALAREFIPNFDPRKNSKERGRPRSVEREHAALAIEIQAIQKQAGIGILPACQRLVKRAGPWKGKRPKDLQARYYRYMSARNASTPSDEFFHNAFTEFASGRIPKNTP